MQPLPPMTPADERRETRRRLTLGLGGLLLMLLLVVLAGYLTGQAREEADVARAQAEAAGVTNPGGAVSAPAANEPFSDVSGPAVATTAAPTPSTGAVVSTTGKGGTVVVPDLEPDPNLDRSQQRR